MSHNVADILDNTPTVGFVFVVPEGEAMPYPKIAMYAAHIQDVLSHEHSRLGGGNVVLVNEWRQNHARKDMFIARSTSPLQVANRITSKALETCVSALMISDDLPLLYCVAFGPQKKSVIHDIAQGCEQFF